MSRLSLLKDVHDGTERWSIAVRVFRRWNVYQKSSPSDLFCTTMILVDQEGTKIQATAIDKNLHQRYRDTLIEGQTYFLANFMVSQNANQYKGTTHPFKIILTQQTFVRPETVDIPLHSYSFMPITDILKSEENNFSDCLIDVVAFVRSMGSLEEYRRDNETKHKLRMLLTDINDIDIECVLFDECSTNAYMAQLENMDTPVVVLINLARIAFAENGRPQICSSFNATRVSFNPPIKEVKDLIDSAKDRETPITTGLSQLMPSQLTQQSASSMMTKNSRIPISQIPDQKIGESFVTNCLIHKLETRHGWTYDGCAKCATKPRDEGNTLVCPTCKRKPDSIEPKLKIHYMVRDETGNASVVFWDKLASELLGKTASELKQILISEQREYDFPDQCDSLVGKRMLLKLKRNNFNAKHIGSSISVIQYTLCEDLTEKFNDASTGQDPIEVTATEPNGGLSTVDSVNQPSNPVAVEQAQIPDGSNGRLSNVDNVNKPTNEAAVETAEIPLSQLCRNPTSGPTKGKRKASLRKTCVDKDSISESLTPSSSLPNGPLLKAVKQEKQ